MRYTEVRSLTTRSAVDQAADRAVEGILLVGDSCALQFFDSEDRTGHDRVTLWPAVHAGQRMFLLRREWCPRYGYCALGTDERLVPFGDGVRMLVERGVFTLPVPEEVTTRSADRADLVTLRHQVLRLAKEAGCGSEQLPAAGSDDAGLMALAQADVPVSEWIYLVYQLRTRIPAVL
jgi:hypothetical protein